MNYSTYNDSVQPPVTEAIHAAQIVGHATVRGSKINAVGSIIGSVLGSIVGVVVTHFLLLKTPFGVADSAKASKDKVPNPPPPKIEVAARTDMSTFRTRPAFLAEKPVTSAPVSSGMSGAGYKVNLEGFPSGEPLNLRENPDATSTSKLQLRDYQLVVLDEVHGDWCRENWGGVEPCMWVRVIAKGDSDELVTGWCRADYLDPCMGSDPIAALLVTFNAEKKRRGYN